ncbi:hypothetical protein AVHM3334_20850 [Acidovorax sp. SUPP3334]|nr:hypothetical protein AVHM3334_20850 [Acidovorax sp. SUPP3334]
MSALVATWYSGERETGIDALSVGQYRTRAALPVIAAFFGAREVKALTQQVEQRDPAGSFNVIRLPVHAQMHTMDRGAGISGKGLAAPSRREVA